MREQTTAYERITAALAEAGARTHQNAQGTRAQCPVHGSRGLSLSVRPGDGRAFLTCFAGCEDTDVLAAVGLRVGDLFDGDDRGGPAPRPRSRPAPLTAWDRMMREAGFLSYPPLDHVLRRMETEQVKERFAGLEYLSDDFVAAVAEEQTGDPEPGWPPVLTCAWCGTPTSPWSCSCGATRTDQKAVS